jgi:hypothetical protein
MLYNAKNNSFACLDFHFFICGFSKNGSKIIIIASAFYQTAVTLIKKETFGDDYNKKIPGFGHP